MICPAKNLSRTCTQFLVLILLFQKSLDYEQESVQVQEEEKG